MNYLAKIMALIDSGQLSVTGYQDVNVHHDADCPALRGVPDCTCDPDIYLHGKKLKLPKF